MSFTLRQLQFFVAAAEQGSVSGAARALTISQSSVTEAIRALEDALEGFAGCAVIVTHDRWFLDRVATHILAFEDDSTVVWHEGNYGDYLEDRRKRLGLESDTPRRPKYRRLTR